MDIKLHFSHTEVPEDVRLHIQTWIREYLSDLEPRNNLRLELFCTKDCAQPKTKESQFKVSMLGRAPWLNRTITVKSAGADCWGTILNCSHRFRQQVTKQRKLHKSHRHETIELIKPTETAEAFSSSYRQEADIDAEASA